MPRRRIPWNRDRPEPSHDLPAKLEQAAIYTDPEVDAAVAASIRRGGDNALQGGTRPAQSRFKDRYITALQTDDSSALETLGRFRSDVGASFGSTTS